MKGKWTIVKQTKYALEYCCVSRDLDYVKIMRDFQSPPYFLM